jgi:plasmid stability protein
MATITVRRLPDEVHRALAAQARAAGKSMEAEARDVIASAVLPAMKLGLGDRLAAIGQHARITDDEMAIIESAFADVPGEPMEFGS